MKVYLSGPISGRDDYRSKFREAASKTGASAVMNPAVLPPGFQWSDYMHVCYAMIDVCDFVFMLRDWDQSVGAVAEYLYSASLGKIIFFEE